MKKLMIGFLFLVAAACQEREQQAMTNAIDQAKEAAGNVATMGEQTYQLEGRIVGRDAVSKQVTVDHKEIPGFMAAMTMPYEVRGADVNSLPANGTEITATVHAKGDTYWLTNIKAK